MVVSINQPAYLPWLGYFDRIIKSDIHIILDNVQFEKNSVINRNKIVTDTSWTWLTVPVKTKGKFGDLEIKELKIDETSKWRKKHYNSLNHYYGKSKYFREHKTWLNYFYDKEWDYLYPLLEESTDYFVETLGIKTPRVRSSKMSVKGNKSKYLLNICLEIGATTYLSGPFGKDYLKLDEFKKEGIKVIFHKYENPNYQQLIQNFQNNMSIVDLIFNEGPKSLEILTGRLNK
tara:strand:+ start:2287 stop:2982 length:696 start_codon:yes stop_codon:yes gene_type:complete